MNATGPADVFTRMLHAIDARDWKAVRNAFADEVDMDYTSLFGGSAARVNADQQIAGWEAFAGAFHCTQHITGPIIADETTGRVVWHTHVRAYHRVQGAAGGDVWMVAAHYELNLQQIRGQWKIAGITLRLLYQEGNFALRENALERAAESARSNSRSAK